MAFSTKSKLGEVLDHPEGAKIMEEYIPGCSTDPDPMIKVARGMTLLNISQLASDKLPAIPNVSSNAEYGPDKN